MLRTLALLLTLAALPALAANDSMSAIKDAAKKQAQGKLAEKLNLPTTAPADAKVYLIAPAKDASVSSPVKVVFGLSGMGVAPAGTQMENTGHHHLLIDDPAVDLTLPLPVSEQIVHFGKGQTETSIALKPGKHTLQLVLGDWKHQAFSPNLTSEKITITVK
ncbi:MAG: DUF4399 domain-containing protein [Panacagrimonas sp.]